MKFLLIALIAFMTLSGVFDWNPGPATGIKVKNILLYLLIVGLLLRAPFDRRLKLELPALQGVFLLLIVYSLISYATVVMVLNYPRYNALKEFLFLKALVDQMLFFVAFFYAVRSDEDALFILKWLAVTWTLSHVVAVLDAFGVVQIGDIEMRSDGRVQGLVGESNQYGAFVALTLPAVLTLAFLARGVPRLMWTLMAVITGATLLMTVSRGAFVAVAVAVACAVYLFRRFTQPGRLFVWMGAGVAALVVVVAAVAALGYGDLLYERVVEGTHGGDMGATSSGRTEIWAAAIEMMFEKPLTLLTGYGWRVYWLMPFRYSPHNFYVNQWFNLGLVGLACGMLLLALPIRKALSAVQFADPRARAMLIGFVVSAITLAVATFFVDLYEPWLYFWAYAGIALRVAMNAQAPEVAATSPAASKSKDNYGWAQVARS